ncbi:tyrosine-type recombinase/integrase [Paraburkholderia edwinii]|uniref:Tyrosine-type recombinase/integrase n=1 Tax=Paraburkholderia edwinii TaxID=2861782 RepID=A0ABX8UR23_9BURK|nr:tyrosine-type recombinase/integrase [Paraburkholderia edwinii]
MKNLPRHDDSRVFPITAETVKRVFIRACKRAEIENLHFHDLRHEACTRIAERSRNLEQCGGFPDRNCRSQAKRSGNSPFSLHRNAAGLRHTVANASQRFDSRQEKLVSESGTATNPGAFLRSQRHVADRM